MGGLNFDFPTISRVIRLFLYISVSGAAMGIAIRLIRYDRKDNTNQSKYLIRAFLALWFSRIINMALVIGSLIYHDNNLSDTLQLSATFGLFIEAVGVSQFAMFLAGMIDGIKPPIRHIDPEVQIEIDKIREEIVSLRLLLSSQANKA